MSRQAFFLLPLTVLALAFAGCSSSTKEAPKETPPAPPPAQQQAADHSGAPGAALMEQKGCIGCHKLHGKGGATGPELTKVGSKYDKAQIKKWITQPQQVKPGTAMPSMPLSDQEAETIADYLAAQK